LSIFSIGAYDLLRLVTEAQPFVQRRLPGDEVLLLDVRQRRIISHHDTTAVERNATAISEIY
jgi:hypothetical protein